VNDKLSLDIGVRYDLVTGFAFDQNDNIIFAALQDAGRAGRLNGLAGFEDFGKEPAEDKNNIAPRVGFTYDTHGDGQLVFRGGVGRYYDFAYTNANILFAVIGRQSSFGQIYSHSNSSGIRNATARSSRSASRCRSTSWASSPPRCPATPRRRSSSSPTPTRPTSAWPRRSARAGRSSWTA
jgi:hypothetical protein